MKFEWQRRSGALLVATCLQASAWAADDEPVLYTPGPTAAGQVEKRPFPCGKRPPLKRPDNGFGVGADGTAKYKVTGQVSGGQVVGVEVSVMTPGVEDQARRATVNVIIDAVQAYSCEQDGRFVQMLTVSSK